MPSLRRCVRPSHTLTHCVQTALPAIVPSRVSVVSCAQSMLGATIKLDAYINDLELCIRREANHSLDFDVDDNTGGTTTGGQLTIMLNLPSAKSSYGYGPLTLKRSVLPST